MTGSATGDRARIRGRESFARGAWQAAYAELTAAEREAPLDLADLERLGLAADLTGREAEAGEALARLHQEHLAIGNAEAAARYAFWLGFRLVMGGEPARGNGWLARARRVLDEAGIDSVVRGFLLIPTGIRAVQSSPVEALPIFEQAVAIGDRYRDTELLALARMGIGRALIRTGRAAEGIALLDEVMVSVTAGEVPPMSMAGIYCSVLEACHEVFDLRRAQEWTDALSAWCEAQPDVMPYRGQCLVRRSEIKQLHGEWGDAIDEAVRACEFLAHPPTHPAIGAAHYQRGEVHRLRGEVAEAEEAYRQTMQSGRQPQPGLALLRLQQGRVDVAAAAIGRALDETRDMRGRTRVLVAYAEIMIAAGRLDEARAAAAELRTIAAACESPYLHATADYLDGAIAVDDRADEALTLLRRACTTWHDVSAPYECARARVLVARCHRALGDEDTARLELEAAREWFARLGAEPDVRRVDALAEPARAATGGRDAPTARETEVLRLIATGKTNRAIAEKLGISEKTVARHVSNLFAKLGLSSRSAATAYAYEHGIVRRPAR